LQNNGCMLSSLYLVMGSHLRQHMLHEILNLNIFVTKIEQKFKIWKKYSFSKFVTLRYFKIVRFSITHLVLLESPQCIGVHTLFCDVSLEEKLSFAINKKMFTLYWQFLVAKIGYIYNNFSCSVWNHVTKVIEYWTCFQWKLN